MYLVKTPWWLTKIYAPGLTWKMPADKNVIYLTFDDGPHPDITLFVLDCLKKYNAKATFFCLGKNVLKYPAVFDHIIAEGHTIGNHTNDHLNGWKTGTAEYLKNILLARENIESNLFRPPYGRI